MFAYAVVQTKVQDRYLIALLKGKLRFIMIGIEACLRVVRDDKLLSVFVGIALFVTRFEVDALRIAITWN